MSTAYVQSPGDTLTVSDFFCGCGGSTTGMAGIDGVDVVRAVNHWALAIESHNANHPDVDHDECDISAMLNLGRFPRTDLSWWSPECTTHSPQSDADQPTAQVEMFVDDRSDLTPEVERSRVTMWDPIRWAESKRGDYLVVENVWNVRRWRSWQRWLRTWAEIGYHHRVVSLSSVVANPAAFPGEVTWMAPQSRDRIYVVAWRHGLPAPDLDLRPLGVCQRCNAEVELAQSWKNGRAVGTYGPQYVYTCGRCRLVAEPHQFGAINAIDPTIPMQRVGDRPKPLSPKTLERFRYGLERHGVQAGEVRPFVVPNRTHGRAHGLDRPYRTFTTGDNHCLVTDAAAARLASAGGFFSVLRGTSPGQVRGSSRAYSDPITTLSAGGGHHAFLSPSAQFTLRGARSLDSLAAPSGAQVTAIQTGILSRDPLIASYYGTHNVHPSSTPLGTLTTKDRHAVVDAPGPAVTVEDLYYRMIVETEMVVAMGLPADYIVAGERRADRVKQIGNAVTPPASELLIGRIQKAASGERRA